MIGSRKNLLFKIAALIALFALSGCTEQESNKDSSSKKKADASFPRDASTTGDASKIKPGATFAMYAIGDSTMADYDTTEYSGVKDRRGWGQMFPQFITNSNITFHNAARNGRSSKSFYTEGLWAAVRAKLKSGDYVFIQFGHNDEKAAGLEGTGETEVGTVARGTYQEYLSKYVDETREAGATPILFTPVVRLEFSGSSLTPKACHDLTGNGTAVGDSNYPNAMKDVGSQRDCTVIDMTASTKALVESYGPTDAKSILYYVEDNTHLKSLGATLFAQLAVQELISKGLFVDDLDAASDLIVSPATQDFGDRYLSSNLDKTFSITGLSLSPDSGTVAIASPDGFAVSATPDGTFASSIEIPYTGGKLSPTNFYVRFTPVVAGGYSGTLTVTPPSGTAKTVTLTGNALQLPVGAIESSVTYSLIDSVSGAVTGLVTATDETLKEMAINYYSADAFTWTTASSSTKIQRLTTTDGNWPAESDSHPSRYAEFAIIPASGKTFTIDTISFYIGGAGGNGLGYSVQYSTNSDFSASTELAKASSIPKNTMSFSSFTNVITVDPDKTFFLRIYPWNKVVASGKYLCLQNLTVQGVVQ